MSNATDMSTPVTRAELREELAKMATKAELREELAKMATKADLREETEKIRAQMATKTELREETDKIRAEMATKTDLEVLGRALLARIESGEHRLSTQMNDMEQRLHLELAGYARAHHEQMVSLISIIDEKYADLPGRVKRLEGAVFPSEPR